MKKFRNVLKVILGIVIVFVIGYFLYTIGQAK